MHDQNPERLARLAAKLLDANRVAEAIEAYERLVAVQPDVVDHWYNLAFLQRKARRFEAALASYGEALDRGIDRPEDVHLNQAVILAEHLRRADEAIAELEAALSINPDFVPALLNLGNLNEDRGERSKARQAYERALAADPGATFALSRLAGLHSVSNADDPLIERLRQAIEDPAARPADKADLGFALGQALDGAGAYDQAFAAYSEANRASREGAGPHALYDREAHEKLVDRLIAAFPRPAADRPETGDGPPIFICGMFRSGSTLAEQILASHSEVTAGGELDLLPALVRTELRPYPEAAAAAGESKIKRLHDMYLDGLRPIRRGDGPITDKRPDNFLYIGLIKTLFPSARIVHTRRNPLDNCLSLFFLHLNPRMSYALDLADAAHWYGQYRRLMAHWKTLYPADIHDVDYDELVESPRPAIAELLDFCGLEWEEACLSFHTTDTAVRTASNWQVREPLYRSSSGRWRNYETHLAQLRAALGDLAE